MLSEPRTIFFQSELVLPTMKEFRVGKAQARALFVRMHQPGGCPFENFEVLQGDEVSLSTKRDEGRWTCAFSPKGIRIEEDQPDCEVDGFIDKFKTVLRGLGDDFPPIVLLQRCRIQCTVKPHHMGSIKLLAKELANVYDTFQPLGRIPTYFGVRFRFLPMDMLLEDIREELEDEEIEAEHEEREDDEPEFDESGDEGEASHDLIIEGPSGSYPIRHMRSDDAMMTLRFETYSNDLSQVWIEAAGEFRAFTDKNVFRYDDIELMGNNIKDTYRFIAERCTKFLEQFDRPQPSDGDGP